MAFMITIDVALRFLFNAPLPASVEISQLLQPYVVLMPMAYTLAISQHVHVGVVTNIMPPGLRAACEVFTYILDFILFAAIAWYGWHEFYDSYIVDEFMQAAIRLPWWVGKFALPAGMALIALQCLVQLGLTIGRIVDHARGGVDLRQQAREGV